MAFRAADTNFSRGELAPQLYARFDVDAYHAGLRKARNVCILKYGGVTYRPGTYVVAQVAEPDLTKPVRLIPFQFSIDQAYVLEFGDQYMRPATGGGMVLETAKAVLGATNAAHVVITCTAHGYAAGDRVFFTGVGGMVELNGRIIGVHAVIDADHFDLLVGGADFGAYTSGGTVARLYKLASPYLASELSEVDHEQTFDVLYLAHLAHAFGKLLRHGNASWEFAAVTFGPTIVPPTAVNATATVSNTDSDHTGDSNAYFPKLATYVVTSVNDAKAAESRASTGDSCTNDLTLARNINTITWTASADANRYRIYKSNNTEDYGYIGQTTALTFTDDNIAADLTDGPPAGNNPFGATADDNPSTVTFFQQRLMLARTRNRPNSVWGSKSADYENMDITRPSKADDGISFTLAAGKVNAVNQLVSLRDLLALTSDGIFQISAGSKADALSPSAIVSTRQNGQGASRLAPIVIDNITFYQSQIGNAVRTAGYTFSQDSYNSDDVSIFSPHLFLGFDIVSWAYAKEPRSLIWAARSDGALLCFTWQQEQSVWGWTLCETAGLVESVACISEANDAGMLEDFLYLVVRRPDGKPEQALPDKRWIERMASSQWTDPKDACHLDAAVRYVFDDPTAVLTNLEHLRGKEIMVLADGLPYRKTVVASGKVTLDFPVTKAIAGLGYVGLVETLPLAFNGPQGWNAGKQQQATTAILRVTQTAGIQAGPRADLLYPVKPRESGGLVQQLYSGDYEINLAGAAGTECTAMIRQDQPLPFTVTGVFLDPQVAA